MLKLRGASLRVRLTVGYALIFSVCVLLGALGVYLAARSTLLHSLDAGLRETAGVAQASIETAGARAYFAPELRPVGDLSIELLSVQGTLIQRVGQPGLVFQLPLLPGLTTTQNRRVLTIRVPAGRLLRVSRPDDTLTEVTETLGRILVTGTLLMIVVACLVGYLLADRALRPIDEVVRTANRIADSGQYLERVSQAPGDDEMARLTGTVNRMLDRLSGTIDREKEFARIAAHELRTPLTAIKGRLDLALERPRDNETYQRTLSVMRGRVNALVRLSEGLLELARSDAPLHLVNVEVGAAALEVADAQAEALRAAGKVLELDVEECWVRAELPGVQQLLLNLVENALKYGGARIRLRVSVGTGVHAGTGGNGGAIEVHDDGPGPVQGDWTRLIRPFERGAALQAVPGSGLGLALVSALATRWNAEVLPVWSESGFSVRVIWPTPAVEAGGHGTASSAAVPGSR